MNLNVCPKNSNIIVENECNETSCHFYFENFFRCCVLFHKIQYFDNSEMIPINLISLATKINKIQHIHKTSKILINILKLTSILKSVYDNNIQFCSCYEVLNDGKCFCNNHKLRASRLKLQNRWSKILKEETILPLTVLSKNTDDLTYIRKALSHVKYESLYLSAIPIGYLINQLSSFSNISQILGLHQITLQKIKQKWGIMNKEI